MITDERGISNEDTFEPLPASSSFNAYAILNSVTVIWGSQHVIIKSALDSYPTASTVNFWRFVVSSLLFLPALYRGGSSNNEVVSQPTDGPDEEKEKAKKSPDEEKEKAKKAYFVLRAGCELGLYTFLGFGFQAIGLESTTASRSAFLLYLNVKFVPFFALLFLGRQIRYKGI